MISDDEVVSNVWKSIRQDRTIRRNRISGIHSDSNLNDAHQSGMGAALFLPNDAAYANELVCFLHSDWNGAVIACASDSVDSTSIRICGSHLLLMHRDSGSVYQKNIQARSLCEIRTILRDAAKNGRLHIASDNGEDVRSLCHEARISVIDAPEPSHIPDEIDFSPIRNNDALFRLDFIVSERDTGRSLRGGDFVRLLMDMDSQRVVILRDGTDERIGDAGAFKAIMDSEQSCHGLTSDEIAEMNGYVGEVESSVRGIDSSGRHIRHAFIYMPARFEDKILRLGRPSLDFHVS